MNNYIKLNDNYNHLSLGNLFNLIKSNAKNKSSAIQTEIFCILFNIDNISDTTVGNYCTGYRAIGNTYKQIYLTYQKKYHKINTILINTIGNIISIMDGYLCDYSTIEEINESISLKKLVIGLHNLAKNDIYVPTSLKKDLLAYIESGNYYEAICNILFFIILEKKQPLYESDLVLETIEEILNNTNMSVNDLKRYLEIDFKEGINFIPSLKKLAEENNPYALHELGNKEYNGEITGYPRYEEAFKYHKLASSFNHPTSYWMLAHMLFNKKIGSLSNDDLTEATTYLEKALSLGSISALNTMGLCYFNGWNKDKEINFDKAKEYFLKAAEKDYLYAYNNLGRLYENNKDYTNALSYYLKSADNEESWACNKVGLYYFNGLGTPKDLKKAFHYFTLGANAPISNRNSWNIYNLIVLFYLKGNGQLGIKKDINKCLELLNNTKPFPEINELYLYCYYNLYFENKTKDNLDKVNYYLSLLNNSLNNETKKNIEENLKKIYNYQIKIDL